MSATEHAREARRLLTTGTSHGILPNHVAAAQAHATLALVEQQRIANVIALFGAISEGASADTPIPWIQTSVYSLLTPEWELRPDIAAALGLAP